MEGNKKIEIYVDMSYNVADLMDELGWTLTSVQQHIHKGHLKVFKTPMTKRVIGKPYADRYIMGSDLISFFEKNFPNYLSNITIK